MERIERGVERLSRSPLLRGSTLAHTLQGLRAGTAGALAQQTRGRSERVALRRTVQQGAAALRKSSKSSWAGRLAEPLDALACLLAGDETNAVAKLRVAARSLAPIPIMSELCTRNLGLLIGGDEGRSLVAQADAFFPARGVVDVARFASAVMPGFERT